MTLALEILSVGILLPAVVAYLAAVACRRRLPAPYAARYASSGAMVVAFWIAFLAHPWTPLIPSQHWHWLPWLGLPAALVAGVGTSGSVHPVERVLLWLLAAAWGAVLLVPTWAALSAQRGAWIIGLTLAMVGVPALLQPLVRRPAGAGLPWFLVVLFVSATIVSVQAGSLKFAQLGGTLASAAGGAALAAPRHARNQTLAGLPLTGGILTVGLLFVSCINSFSMVPWYSYVLVAGSPLMLWCGPCLGRGSAGREAWIGGVAGTVPAFAGALCAVLSDAP